MSLRQGRFSSQSSQISNQSSRFSKQVRPAVSNGRLRSSEQLEIPERRAGAVAFIGKGQAGGEIGERDEARGAARVDETIAGRDKGQRRDEIGEALDFLADMIEILDVAHEIGLPRGGGENERPNQRLDMADARRKDD